MNKNWLSDMHEYRKRIVDEVRQWPEWKRKLFWDQAKPKSERR